MNKKNKTTEPVVSTPKESDSPRKQANKQPAFVTILNVRFVLLLGAILLVACPALYFWHAYQINRLADGLLVRATQLAEGKGGQKAVRNIRQYLKLRPTDVAAHIQLAKTFDKIARSPGQKQQAILFYDRAIGLVPQEESSSLLSREAELYLELGRFRFAEEQADTLLELEPQNKEGLWIRAVALYRQSVPDHRADKPFRKAADRGPTFAVSVNEAITALEHAFQSNPKNPVVGAVLAEAYRTSPPHKEKADSVIKKLLEVGPENAEALLIAYRFYFTENASSQADPFLERALEIAPKDHVANLFAAQRARNRANALRKEDKTAAASHYQKAIGYYEKAIESNPLDRLAYSGLGEAHLENNRRNLASKAWRQGLKMLGKSDWLLNLKLAESLIDQSLLKEASVVLETLDQKSLTLEAKLTRPQSIKARMQIDLLRGRWLFAQGDILPAITVLERVVAAQSGAREQTFEIPRHVNTMWLLGQAYRKARRWDQAAITFQKAAALWSSATNSSSSIARLELAAAEAWDKAGQPEMARSLYAKTLQSGALRNTPWEAAASLGRAQTIYRAALQRSPTSPKTNWRLVLEAVDAARQLDANSWELKLLEANLAMTPGARSDLTTPTARSEEAYRLLKEIEQPGETENKSPLSAQQREALVLAFETIGKQDEANRLLKTLSTEKGGQLRHCLLKANLLIRREQVPKAKALLEKALATSSKEEHLPIERAIVQIEIREGQTDRAIARLTNLCKANPQEPRLTQSLFELLLQERQSESGHRKSLNRQLAAAKKEPERTRKLEGERKTSEERLASLDSQLKQSLVAMRKLDVADGTLWSYHRARWLLEQTINRKDSRFLEAKKLQADIEAKRPSWHAAFSLKGRITRSEGRDDLAAAAFERAIKNGDRRTATYALLIESLYRLNELQKADAYLDQLRQSEALSPRLSSLAINVAAGLGDWDRVVQQAEKQLQQSPEKVLSHVWYAQSLFLAQRTQEAENTFRKAVQQFPRDIQAWNALFSYCAKRASLGKTQEEKKKYEQAARVTLQQMAKNVKGLQTAQLEYALAQGYELFGDRQEAERHYRLAANEAPKNVPINMRWAAFLFQEDVPAAERVLRNIKDQSAEANRALAVILENRGGEAEWKEAQELIEANLSTKVEVLDRRLQAVLLSRRTQKERQRAKQILEELVADPISAAPSDYLLLAELDEAQAQTDDDPATKRVSLRAARKQLLALAGRPDHQPVHLANLVLFLLRHHNESTNYASDALPWLSQLEKEAPQSLATLSLRVQWLKTVGQPNKIAPRVESFVIQNRAKSTTEASTTTLLLGAAELLSSNGFDQAAERYYREFIQTAPEKFGVVALSLAKQRRASEAIQLCLSQWKAGHQPETAMTIATVLLVAHPSPEASRLAEPVIVQAIQQYPENTPLQTLVATLRHFQNKFDASDTLYLKVLKREPSNVTAMNNRAAMLAEQPTRLDDALNQVNQAMTLAPKRVGLLDTKGMILFHQGKAKEAAKLLEQAISRTGQDPRYHYHLALAKQSEGDAPAAKNHLEEALKRNLDAQILTPLEKSLLTKLKQSLNIKLP